MLKKSLILAAVMAAAVSSYGQGLITFDTTGKARVTNAADGANLSGAAWLGQLYASSTADGSLTALGTPQAFRAGVNAGYVRIAPPASSTLTAPTAAPGGTTYLSLRAWESKYATYEEAVAGGGIAGASKVWAQATSDPGAQPPAPPQALNGLEAFSVAVVPEPSLLALMGVGAAALLLRRRK
jgi:hypothetical protein